MPQAHNACEESLRDGAGNGTRTRDIELGKLALYQLSYARPVNVLGSSS